MQEVIATEGNLNSPKVQNTDNLKKGENQFDTGSLFVQSTIDEWRRVKAAQINEPTYNPSQYYDQLHFQQDGKLWANIDNDWYKVYDSTSLPDIISNRSAGANSFVRPSYTDTLDALPHVSNDPIATLYITLRFRSYDFTLYTSGVEQTVRPIDIWPAITSVKGLLVYNGYFYFMGDNGLGTYRVYRCPITSDITTVGNWTLMTVSGTAISGTSYLIGVQNNSLWVATGSAFVPYSISGSTLTSGTSVTVTGSSYSIESRINDNAIYADYSSDPRIKKADFSGTLTGTVFYIGGVPDSTLTYFCSPSGFYSTMYSTGALVIGYNKID